MNYEFSGYLSTILYKPDPEARDSVDSVLFDGTDLAKWKTKDLDHFTEWRHVPVKKQATEDGVRIEGDFRDVAGIESLSPDDPRYWVPLSTTGIKDSRLPIDLDKYPIVEVTYRLTSERAHPVWMWTYDGGSHFGALPKTRQWHTVARNAQHFGFPSRLDNVIIRLYSPTRSIESMEIAAVRFRAMTQAEAEATRKSLATFEDQMPPRHFPILDEFMPLGVYMDADSAKRLAKMLGISPREYWELVMEDIVAQNHNTIALAHVDRLEPEEWHELLALADTYGVKFVPRHEFPIGGPEEEQQRFIETHIKPSANSPAIFARTFSGEPIEDDFRQLLAARAMIEENDPSHPVAIVARHPNSYPLFAPFFAASSVGHLYSRRPWDLGKSVRTHIPLSDAQQFWMTPSAFMYSTQAPEWHTCPEMRLMVNLAFLNGARGWFSYSYHNDPLWLRGRLQRTLTGPFLTFSDLWSELKQRMKRASALAPLFLSARSVDDLEDWFAKAAVAESGRSPAPGVPPISQYHLRGPDYDLYSTTSNNTREMTAVNISIPAKAVEGKQVYDLSAYVRTREWVPMERQRHIEMFPGQATIILVARPERCDHWRDIVATRLIQSDLRKLHFNLKLARAYDLDFGQIEAKLDAVEERSSHESLHTIQWARDALHNLIYDSPAITQSRSKIIEASAAVCACDGALCRLMHVGKTDQAREMGGSVVPLAREFTNLRLDLRRGNGAQIYKASENLVQRSLKLLAEIRAEF